MNRFIDLHCHILPGVDDGPSEQEEMRQMLKIAYDEGIRYMIATPHHHPYRGHEAPEILRKQLAAVRREAHAIDESFHIYLGMEVYFGQDIPEKLADGRVLTMNGRSVVLLEFSPEDSFHYILQGIQQIQMTGNEVILAHAERYRCLIDEPERVEYLCGMGVHIQVNASTIAGKSGYRAKKFVKQLLAQNLVFAVGTDAHSAGSRAPKMKKAAHYVKKKYGKDYMRRIFFGNAAELLKKMNG